MENFRDISWKIIDKYFADNHYNLVDHHLSSFDSFFNTGIVSIFRENNPIRFIEPENKDDPTATRNECLIYLGGKDGSKLYFGKPIIYDDISADKKAHYMYPNDARLRNMTYGITVHFDVVAESIYYVGDERKTHTYTNRAYLGRFPLMTQSNMCILRNLTPEVRFNMGECRNDFGGYFIIDGKEKSIVPQEKFADNIINIKKNKIDTNIYSHSADIRSVSEDPSKPIRTTSVKIVAPTTVLSNNQVVVMIPNVKKPIPLFILMRALGIVSDKNIIEYCLLDLNKNANYVDLFIPSIHDANKVFNQQTALEYIALFTKYGTITYVHNILMNFFLPHIGEDNYLDKAYFVGYMVNKLIRVFMNDEKPTDRDNFRYKRVETDGSLLYDLFREYYLIQRRDIALKIDSEYYFHVGQYKNEDFVDLISVNFHTFFKEKIIETGFRKAFKGNWGATGKTKRVGIVQDMNRLSWFTFISQLRKINLDLDASAKVTGPRLLNSSQWGYIDPIDTPDGGNIGLHKHLAISTHITSGFSCIPLIKWLRSKTPIRLLQECYPELLASLSKVFVNGIWIGSVENPLEMIDSIKLFRRNGLIPIYTSVSFNYENNEIFIYTDAGRLTRPIYYLFDNKHNKLKGGTSSSEESITSSSIVSSSSSSNSSSSSSSYKKKQFNVSKEISINRPDVLKKMNSITWEQIVSGFKKEGVDFNYKNNMIYDIFKFYPNIDSLSKLLIELEKDKSLVDFVDPSEEEGLMIAISLDDVKKSKFYTHVEIEPSLMFGVMGNQICYPENNPVTRNAFSCGQSKQAVSVYHSNYQMRMDKMGVVLNYGQIPLIKSKYTEYFNNEEQPYGVNGIIAIMSYTGYNVEDAILINEGSIKRGMFNTTYFTMYETREESSKMGNSTTNAVFADVMKKEVSGLKEGYDYSYLDKYGLVKENTALNEKIVIIGKVSSNSESTRISDASVFTKKGQLGFVDKSFITEGEEGFRIAKIRVREERIPSLGDKMAARQGQKGTIGLIIPEEDMPFTEDGIRPDLIINPHALPSRMTIGTLLEILLGKVCASYGGFGDCTAFANKGPNTEVYGSALVKAGFHSSGNQVMYNGMNGEQLFSDIYIGPTYYMRLKHMVKDKINFRARGPNAMLTRQPVGGRANDGGLAIGSMERDGVIAHGAMGFLTESFLDRADDYSMAICNKTGCTAIYNETLNLFISPFADGPLRFKGTVDGKINIENVSKFGRSFSIVRIPYTLKLMIQELQVMNIQMRIITEDNIDQLISMSYSNNINKVLNDSSDLDTLFKTYKSSLQDKLRKERDNVIKNMIVQPKMGLPELETETEETPSPEYAPFSPAYVASPSPEIPDELKNIEQQIETSPQYDPNSPFDYKTELDKIKNPKIKSDFEALSERDQKLLMKMLSEKRMKDQKKIDKFKNMEKISILETDENKPKLEDIQEITESGSELEPINEGATSISDLKPLDMTSDAGKVKVITIKE